MQNSHLLHSFHETVQVHFKNMTNVTTQKYQPLKNPNDRSQNDGWAEKQMLQ